MTHEIAQYKPLVAAQVGYGAEKEILHWEGTIEQFDYIYQQGHTIRFARHGGRAVHTTKIVDHWQVDQRALQIEQLLETLEDNEKKTVKSWIRQAPQRTGKEATVGGVQNMIKRIRGEDQQEEEERLKKLTDFGRAMTKLQVNKGIIAKIITGKPWGFRELNK